ncbi:PDGLE domain-containing protein [Chloroflexota bacterium]
MKMKWWHIGLFICLAVALFSPLASASPDGLERVAEDAGFTETAKGPAYEIIADYIFPGIKNEAVATVVAGLVGTLILFVVVYSLAWLLRARKQGAR